MALPGDVTTFELTFGDDVWGYTDATGVTPVLVGARGKLFPINLATGKRINLVHVATGQTILPESIPIVLDVGGKAKATVGPIPHTDNAGLSTVGFAYRVEWDIASNKPSPGNKTFAVPTAAGASVDFDLLDVAEAVPGVLVPMGVSAGVADAAVSALIPGPSLTATALRAALVPVGGALTSSPAYAFLRELRRNTRDLTWLHIGPSTARGTKPWPRTVLDTLGAAYPARTTEYIAPLDTDPLAYQPAQVRQTGSGAYKLSLYNASRSGKTSRYVLGSNWAIVAGGIPTPDLISISHGHNDAATREFFRSDYAALVETVKARFPFAEIILVADNPNTANTNQEMRAQEIARLARARGYGLANVHDAFALRPGGFAELMLDNVHPNEAGHDLMAATVMRQLTWNDAMVPLSSGISSLLDATENLSPEGAFRGWDGTSAITGFATTGPATLSKDLTNFETKGYGVKVTATGASGVLQYTLPADRLALVKGREVTLAVRLFVPDGSPSGVGRVGFTDGSQRVGNALAEGQGAFRWAVFSGSVSPTATVCRLLIYAADSNTSAGGTITVDRVVTARGTLPRDYFIAP